MKRRVILTGFCVLLFAACSRSEEKIADQVAREPARVEVRIPGPYDLGGPCREGGSSPVVPTSEREEALRKVENWQDLIEAFKENVRNNCAIPYRWQQLFQVLVEARRYREATEVANELTRRGAPIPHAVMERTGSEFLTSPDFKETSIGVQYAKEAAEIERLMRTAQAKLASTKAEDLPPNPYNSKGACPFECCTYRRWVTKEAVRLLDSVGSSKVIEEIPAHASILAITGEVHLEPEPYVVLENNGKLKAGDIIFFLDNEGEGYVNYWYEGKLNPGLGLDDGLLLFVYEDCMVSDQRAACSIRKMQPEKNFLNEWWVKIRTARGTEGWVLNTGQFENMDACG